MSGTQANSSVYGNCRLFYQRGFKRAKSNDTDHEKRHKLFSKTGMSIIKK